MNTRRLVTDAVLIALYVVLNFYTIRLGWLNISLAAFPRFWWLPCCMAGRTG